MAPFTRRLTAVLGMVAGAADVTSFLGVGLFTSHITGNLVVLAAHLAAGTSAPLGQMVAVPVFMLVVGATRLVLEALPAGGRRVLPVLLLIQFLLLAAAFAAGLAAGRRVDPGAAAALVTGLLGVSAMAVQNALVQLALPGAPATAVMTTNVVRFTLDVAELGLRRDAEAVARAGRRAAGSWPAIAGFLAGGGAGAALAAAAGLRSLALPAGLALVALGMGMRAPAEV